MMAVVALMCLWIALASCSIRKVYVRPRLLTGTAMKPHKAWNALGTGSQETKLA